MSKLSLVLIFIGCIGVCDALYGFFVGSESVFRRIEKTTKDMTQQNESIRTYDHAKELFKYLDNAPENTRKLIQLKAGAQFIACVGIVIVGISFRKGRFGRDLKQT